MSACGGVHYSTSEVFTGDYWIDGKKIYRKTVDCGALPDTAQKVIAHNISNVKLIWIDMAHSIWKSSSGSANPLPSIGLPTNEFKYSVAGSADATNIYITTGVNRSNFNAVVTVLYTKTTD